MRIFDFLITIIKIIFRKKITASLPSSPIIKTADANSVLVEEARGWVGTKDPVKIDIFRRAVNPHPVGESWCADFVLYCVQKVEKQLGVKSEIYRDELCWNVWQKSPLSMHRPAPEPGFVVIWKHGNTTLGHMGIVESVRPDGVMITIEGNTGIGPGVQREGDGVYRRLRTQQGTEAMSVIGFLKVF